MKNEKNLWILIAAVAAAVAAATTVVILIARARQKAANLVEPIYDCGCCDDACCDDEEQCVCEAEAETEEDVTE